MRAAALAVPYDPGPTNGAERRSIGPGFRPHLRRLGRAWLAPSLLVVALGCDSELFGGKDDDGPPDVDGNPDTTIEPDADVDADSDSDTDTDVDTDGTGAASDLDCNADFLATTPAPGAAGLGACVTQELACGDVIYATNTGG